MMNNNEVLTNKRVISAADLVFSKQDSKWESAIEKWRELLGPNRVVTEASDIEAVSLATFNTQQQILAVLRPASTYEVSDIMKIAFEYDCPVYPVSKGRNWGFGSKVPVAEKSVLLDLAGLDQISDYSEKYGYLVVEPGVSFTQCWQFLTDQKSKFFINVIGGPGEASVIGNVLERGDGLGPYSERLPFVSDFEVVLADGRIIRTGFGSVKKTHVSSLFPFGIGPYLDGIFTQSNFGIVTRMTVWLTPIPSSFKLCSFGVDSHQSLGKLVDSLRPLFLNRVLDSPMFFWNDYKQLAGMFQFQSVVGGGKKVLSDEVMSEYKKKYKFSTWNGLCGLYHSKGLDSAVPMKLRRVIRQRAKRVIFTSPKILPLLRLFKPILKLIYPDIDHRIEMLRENPFLGHPFKVTSRGLYWRKQKSIGSYSGDPNVDKCGAIWECVVVPFDGDHIEHVVSTLSHKVLTMGFEPNLAFLLSPSGRHIRLFMLISYDREIEGEDDRAWVLHKEIFHWLERNGYTHNRLDINLMSEFTFLGNNEVEVLHALKKALDPKNIIAGGRYAFTSE